MGNMNKVYKHYRNLDYVITYPNEFDENEKSDNKFNDSKIYG